MLTEDYKMQIAEAARKEDPIPCARCNGKIEEVGPQMLPVPMAEQGSPIRHGIHYFYCDCYLHFMWPLMTVSDEIWPRQGERWRHYKGNIYEILMFVLIENNRQPAFAYRRSNVEGHTPVWIRPANDFIQPLPDRFTDKSPILMPGEYPEHRRFVKIDD